MNHSHLLFPIAILLLFCSKVISQGTNPKLSDLTKLSYAEIDSLAEIHYQSAAYAKAIPYMQAGREKAKNQFTSGEGYAVGTLDSTYAFYTSDLGFYYNICGQFELAEPLFKEAINIREKVLGKYHSQLAESILNLATLYQSMGNFDAAEPLLLQSKEIWFKTLGSNHPNYATSLNNLAALYKAMGRFELAEPLYLQAIGIRAKVFGLEHPDYALSLNNLATLYENLGRLDDAENLFLQANKIYAKSLGLEHPSYAASLSNLAVLYEDMGRFEAAEALYLQVVKIESKVLGLNHTSYANSLNNLASLYKKMRRFEAAEPLYLQAIAIKAKTLGLGHPFYAISLNNLAGLYQDMAQFDKAWNYLSQAMKSMSGFNMSMPLSLDWADSIKNTNIPSYQHIDKIVKTLWYAYTILSKNDDKNSLLGQSIITDLALSLLKKSRDKFTNEEDKLRLLSLSNDWTLRSLKVLSKTSNYTSKNNDNDKDIQANKAFELAEQNKSVLLLQATKAEKAYQLGDLPDSLVLQDKALLKQRDKLQAKLLEKNLSLDIDSLRILLNQVNQDIEVFNGNIKKNYPKYAKFQYQNLDTKVEDIQKLLDDKTALLEYVIGDSVIYIFYIDKHHLTWVQRAVRSKTLLEKTKSLHLVLSNYVLLAKKPNESYQIYTETAHWFYENLVAPVIKEAKEVEQLIIVTDGELGHLPFESFLVEQAPQTESNYADLHYLVNDFSISYNYSATLWKENKEAAKPKNNSQILAMASNYAIQLDTAAMDLRLPAYQRLRKTLQVLPEARKEVGILSDVFNGFFGLDKMASEKIFKEKSGDYAIIHLAMHGLLDSKAPILSSLAFTEDGDSVENNFLQAYEISKLKLNADLVILSACETGYGKFEKGNGIASLARSFMYAGASSLIVSLWQVNDFATAEIMKRLYQNLAQGMDKAEALRQAKLDYIKTAQGIAAHPAFWSPFVQIGNTQPVSIKTKGGSLPWVLGGGFVLLIVGGLLWWIRVSK